MDKKDFAELMKIMFVAYGKDPQKDRMAVYYEFLKEFPIRELEQTVRSLIKTSKTVPTIEEITDAMYPIPNEAEIWNDINQSFQLGTKPVLELSRIIRKDCPNLGQKTPDEARKAVHFSYVYNANEYKKALKSGMEYLPDRETRKENLGTGHISGFLEIKNA